MYLYILFNKFHASSPITYMQAYIYDLRQLRPLHKLTTPHSPVVSAVDYHPFWPMVSNKVISIHNTRCNISLQLTACTLDGQVCFFKEDCQQLFLATNKTT